ncbi:MAG: VCBS repeat-containing protein [Anaerolineales bacterium]
MSKSGFFAVFILWSMFFSACSNQQSVQPTATPTLIPTLAPTATPIPNNCSKAQKEYKPFEMPESWKTISDPYGEDNALALTFAHELEESLIGYLNHNGTPYQLFNDLRYTGSVLYADIREHDFDKDGENEVLIAIEIFKKEYRGIYLLIAKCNQNEYQFVTKMDNFGTLAFRPRIVMIKDLNNDGYSEVILQTIWEGSDAAPFMYVMKWDQESKSFVDVLHQQGIIVFYDDNMKISIGDVDRDNLDEIVFYGRIEHFEDKRATYTYGWDGYQYKRIKEEVVQ